MRERERERVSKPHARMHDTSTHNSTALGATLYLKLLHHVDKVMKQLKVQILAAKAANVGFRSLPLKIKPSPPPPTSQQTLHLQFYNQKTMQPTTATPWHNNSHCTCSCCCTCESSQPQAQQCGAVNTAVDLRCNRFEPS